MPRALTALLGAASVLAVVAWLVIALLRVGHPFELEWQEGGMLAHVLRVRAGQPLYAQPSLDFVAYPYPPLYVWVCALVGDGFVALRAVSIVSTVAILALLFVGGRRAGSNLAGLAAAGIYAAGYQVSGAWFDVGRNDSLALALTLGALALVRWKSSLRVVLGAGVLAGLAILTKQNMALPTGALGLALLLRDRRTALAYVGALVVVAGGVSLGLELASGGWYRFYIWDLLRDQPLAEDAGYAFEGVQLVLVVALISRFRRPPGLPSDGALHAAVIGLFAATVVARLSIGAFDNTLMPGLLAGALLAGDALARCSASTRAALSVLLLVQLGVSAYDPRAQVPRAADVSAGESLVRELAALEGEVLLPGHPYLLERAGKSGGLHFMALMDLSASESALPYAQRLTAELSAGFAAGRWSHVVLNDWERMEHVDPAERETLRAFFEEHLVLQRRLFVGESEGLCVPVTGARQRPELVYVPRE